MKRILRFSLILAILVTGCNATSGQIPTVDPNMPVSSDETPTATTQPYVPGDNPFSPKPGDSSLTKEKVFITFAQVLAAESDPPQIFLALTGTMPTPCHELRVVIFPPNDKNEVQVEAYTVVDPNVMCAQVIAEFSENISMGIYPPGFYTVFLNGEEVGTFNS